MEGRIECWHFAGETLRDGSPLPVAGVTLPEIRDPKPCVRGYHGSVLAIDGLSYAPGTWVARVRLHGIIIPGNPIDKHCASLRTGLTDYVNAEAVLAAWSRWAALQVAHLWDAPPVVREFLETGRADLRDAAAWWAATAEDKAAAGGVLRAAATAAWWAATAEAEAKAGARRRQGERLEEILTILIEAAAADAGVSLRDST